jgi:hypothetical protein
VASLLSRQEAVRGMIHRGMASLHHIARSCMHGAGQLNQERVVCSDQLPEQGLHS